MQKELRVKQRVSYMPEERKKAVMSCHGTNAKTCLLFPFLKILDQAYINIQKFRKVRRHSNLCRIMLKISKLWIMDLPHPHPGRA